MPYNPKRLRFTKNLDGLIDAGYGDRLILRTLDSAIYERYEKMREKFFAKSFSAEWDCNMRGLLVEFLDKERNIE